MTSRILLGFLLCAFLFPLTAQEVNFRHLAVEDGLSQNTINCIYQDHYGFIWFGTQDGLNCYDGFKFTVYRSDPADSATLSHNWIWDIIEDDSHNLWIATWEGLSKYDRQLKTFKRFLPDSTDLQSISGTRPASMARDHKGQIWIGSWGGGLNVLDPVAEVFSHYHNAEEADRNYPGDYVRKIYIDREETIWIGTWNGLWRCRVQDDGNPVFESFRYSLENPSSIGSDRITSFEEDTKGRLWIGTLGGGLNLYNPESNSFSKFMHEPDNAYSVSSNDIASIEISPDGSLWVGTVTSGLNNFEMEEGRFIHYHSDPADPASLASENVYALYTDRGGVMWVGAGGLNIFDPSLLRFSCSGPLRGLVRQMEGMSVYALFEDSKGLVWAGSHHQGLATLDPESGQVRWYTNIPGDTHSIGSNSVSGIAEGPEEELWISTIGGGLNRLDRSTGKWTRYRENKEQPETRGLDYISGIVVDERGWVWIATSDKGIISYDPEKDHYSSFRTRPGDPSSLAGDYLLRIFKDSQGDIWIGTWGAGLNKLDRETERFTRFISNPSDPSSLPGNIVHSIHEQIQDSGRRIWVGTASGLASIDPDDPEAGFRPSPANAELPSLSVYGTLFDKQGQQWISTNAGISCFLPGDQSLKHFTHRDGLPGNEYNAGSFLELQEGLLAFGGIGGLLIFHPDSLYESSFQPQIALTSFSVLNKAVYEGIDLNAMESISLSHQQNFFSFEFASMDFSDPQKNSFMYKLEGIDKDWIASGRRNYASYTKIDPGDYLFRVKGTNGDGIWSAHEARVLLSIAPPFWQRWWFRGLLIGCGLMFFYAIHLYRIQRVREIERLRTRIASDLHDDIGSALTRISVHSQQILAQDEMDRVRLSTRKINELSREVISTMSDVVWSIDARNDSLADFLSRMQDLTHTLLSEKEISVAFSHEGMESKRQVKVQVRQNLYYIFKEAINNIAKHSGADRVEIKINNSDASFRMKILDDGSGFDPGSIERGNGIKNMRMRAERIGASLEIASEGGVLIALTMRAL